MAIKLSQYKILNFAPESLSGLNNKAMSNQARTKILDKWDRLDTYNTDFDMLGKKSLENTGRYGLWTIKVKDRSKVEWRVFFKKIPDGYAIINVFQKTTPKITKREIETALRICKREGW